jgi:hypothetical protein
MISMPWLVLLPLVAVLALLVGYFGSRAATARTLGDAETRASRILEDAKRLVDQARADADSKVREADTKVREAETRIRNADLEAKELALRVRGELDQDTVNTGRFETLWAGYSRYLQAVQESEPSHLSLRDKDRYLWGRSSANQLVADIERWSKTASK